MIKPLFILFVENPKCAKKFYEKVLDIRPTLDAEGMTEFTLDGGAKLGLMPFEGIKRLLGKALLSGSEYASPRAEMYLYVEKPQEYSARALRAGAIIISPLSRRDWGDETVYLLDPEGHIIAFARTVESA